VVAAFRAASGQPIPCQIDPRRPGDIAAVYADPAKALRLLGWKAERGISEMCADAWRWQKNNPYGYVENKSGK
jgi:UDP-glucose 4-epimerase